MDKCPKCGAALSRGLKYTFVCGTSELTAGGYDDGKECLRRQLAAAKETETTLRSALHHQQDKRIEAEHALAACDQSPWRGMDSAPKDGTRVLLFDDGTVLSGSYEFGEWSGWCHSETLPTHWMPLPEAPKEKP